MVRASVGFLVTGGIEVHQRTGLVALMLLSMHGAVWNKDLCNLGGRIGPIRWVKGPDNESEIHISPRGSKTRGKHSK